MDILVTVGVILAMIAVGALVIHVINVHHAHDIAEHEYEAFHPGDPHESAEEQRDDTAAGRPRRG
ncbi:MAG: hypothetical protein ACRDP3_05030 [Streptomyces sp.]|uniref:hypothetical protein n=1 Tax=Streptomyces sp. TaxID=1931 RepID=UPI003D6A6235